MAEGTHEDKKHGSPLPITDFVYLATSMCAVCASR